MAEEVQIGNVGGDGVASEVTLLRLVQATEAMAKKAGIDSKGAAAKLQALYNKEVTTSAKATGDQTVATESQTVATKEATRETNKFAAQLGNAVATGLGALVQSSWELGKSFMKGETGVENFVSQLPGVGGFLAPFGKYMDESIDSYRALSQVGATFGGSLSDVRLQASELGMNLDQMTSLYRNQADSLASLGGSIEQGAVRFAKMNKNMKATGDFAGLMRMGFTMEEVNEGMGDYIANQQRMGTLQGKSTQELAEGSANYLTQIDKLARVTGKTREEAQAALDAQAADSVARTLLNQFAEGSDEYNNLQMSLGMLDEVGGATAEALKGMLTGSPTKAAGELLGVLGDAGPAVLDAMTQIGKGADPKILQEAMRNAGGSLEQFAGANAQERARMIQAFRENGDPMADFFESAMQLTKIGERDIDEVTKQQQRLADAKSTEADAVIAFEEQQRALSAAMHKAFISSGVLELIETGLTGLSTALGGVTAVFNAFSEGGLYAGVELALTKLWENKGVIGALVAGIGLMFAGKAVLGAMTGGIKSALSGLMGMDTGGGNNSSGRQRGGGKPGGGIGAGIGKIGAGIGSGLGGILSGLAKGIGAFGKPQVALGAAVLAGTILAVGAAVAGATWMVGAALPTFATGMKSFEDLDGGALKAAGMGMLAVAGGMAAFGAGTAVAGIGNLVGGIADGIGALFGNEKANPMDQLMEFQKYTIDEAKVTSNANAMVAYSKAMAAMGAADGISGIGSAVGAFGGTIAGLFGADSPLDKITLFQAYTFDTAKIKSNSEAVVAYSKAMALLGGSDAVSGIGAAVGAVGGAIANLFTGGKGPFDDLLAFQAYAFNTENITKNSSAIVAFSNAMDNMPEIDVTRTGGVFGAIAGWFAGDEVMPWDSVKAFGDANINAEGVSANAAAINAMSTSLNTFSVEKLDTTGIVSYTNAMERLVEVLGELNNELSKDNNGYSLGSGTNAGDVLGKMDSIGSGGGAGSDQLNSTMQRVELILTEIRGFEEKVANNTRNISSSNIAAGGVSN